MNAVRHRADVIVFFDDDFVPSRHAIGDIADLFASEPRIAGATGLVIADGVTRGGIGYEQARSLVQTHDATHDTRPPPAHRRVRRAYGCNMAFRVSAIAGLSFDERLPLYGWQEDVDFAGQAATRGWVVETDAFAGVHCGVSSGRMPGTRLGYSQIANPVYLMRKGTMGAGHALGLMARNLVANHVKAVAPEKHIDRLGRLRGNWLALSHAAQGRMAPEKVLQL